MELAPGSPLLSVARIPEARARTDTPAQGPFPCPAGLSVPTGPAGISLPCLPARTASTRQPDQPVAGPGGRRGFVLSKHCRLDWVQQWGELQGPGARDAEQAEKAVAGGGPGDNCYQDLADGLWWRLEVAVC